MSREKKRVESWCFYELMARAGEYGDIVSPDAEIALPPELQIEADFLIQHLQGRSRVLDVGCGMGFPALAIAPHVNHLVAFDAAPSMLSRLRSHVERLQRHNIAIIRARAQALPFAGGQFDGAAICGTLGSLTEPQPLLAELHRVTQPGAIVACIAENFADKLLVDKGKDLRRFRMDDGQLCLQVIEYLHNPYRIRDYRYLISKDCELYENLLGEHEGALSWQTPTQQTPADLPQDAVETVLYDEAVQFDPLTLKAALSRAGFRETSTRLSRHFPVQHIFAAFQRT